MKIQYIDLNTDNKTYIDVLKSDQSINQYIHVDDIKLYVDYLLKTPNVKYKFVFNNGVLVGALHIETTVKVGTFSIEILSKFQRRGVGYQILTDLKQNRFKLDINSYIVYIESYNVKSIKLFEKSEFLLDGIQDNLHKYVYIMS
jgi:RimJ/RimL family protein N-acetyltransferase